MDTFDKCLGDWMKENGFTLSGLTSRLGYKSKTTIARVLKGKYTYSGCRKIYEAMKAENLPEPPWTDRFEQSLTIGQYGKPEYEMIQAIRAVLTESPSRRNQEKNPPAVFSELLIAGCPWKETSRMIRQFISACPEVKITHYLKGREISQNPSAMTCLIEHLTDLQYQAFQIPEESFPEGLTWNFALGRETNAETESVLTALKTEVCLTRIPAENGAFGKYARYLGSLGAVPLYRHDRLSSGMDYIQLMEESYRMERNHRAAILKPTPGIQMMPTKPVHDAFMDYMKLEREPVHASKASLQYLLQKRSENFTNQSRPICLILSPAGMERFVLTGYLSDQFYALRPYTSEERREILRHLLLMAHKDHFTLRLIRKKRDPRFSCEAYENAGVLIYPGNTSYNSERGSYRELFLPGKDLFALFDRFSRDMAEGPDCMSAEETEKTIISYLRMLE